MKMTHVAGLLALCPSLAGAGGLAVATPIVPLAPSGVMAHSAYLALSNTGEAPRSLIGVEADGYAMAHIHRSEETGGVATMSAVEAVEIAPDQTVRFVPGGLHIMLMHPASPQVEGSEVPITLHFANGEALKVNAKVTRMSHGS